jgi:hypothetical protein
MARREIVRDPALQAGVLRRDRDALADAYAEFGAAVWLAARRGGSERSAGDVTEAVFVSFWRDPDQYDGSCSLGSWLVGMAETLAHAAAVPPDASDTNHALAALPSEACLAIAMAQRGATCDQIAAALHTDAASVQRLMRQGLLRVSGAVRSGSDQAA